MGSPKLVAHARSPIGDYTLPTGRVKKEFCYGTNPAQDAPGAPSRPALRRTRRERRVY
jgi:hypothetical protein